MITGAIIGAVGSILNKGISIFENVQQAKIDEKRRSDEIEIAKINAGKDMQVASYKHDTEGGLASQWVVDVIRLVRPAITFYALAGMTIFWFYATPADQSVLVLSMSDLSAMAVSWWFGSRDFKRQ